MKIEPPLAKVLMEAIDKCHHHVSPDKRLEEHGGWLLRHKTEGYKFCFLRNDNSNTPRANVLFTANREDVGKGPLKWLVNGWENYGTFHTHPQFSVTPSTTDWSFLFQNSPHNFIYSPVTLQLGVWSRIVDEDKEKQKWQQHVFDVVYDELVPAARIRKANEKLQ